MFSPSYSLISSDLLPSKVLPRAGFNLVWFSKTVGPGRGLEAFCTALSRVQASRPITLHLIGSCSPPFREALQQLLASCSSSEVSLNFIGPLPPATLSSILPLYDLGLALEQRFPLSRDLTVTYKFFQYISSGLAVLSTPTTGQLEAQGLCPGSVVYSDDASPESLLGALQQILQHGAIDRMKQASRLHSVSSCNWSTYSESFLKIISSRLLEMSF